jgi:hypothetical protein
MPRPLRLTMFFTDGKTGWSESHMDMKSPDLTTAVTVASNVLAPARQALMADGPWLQYLRASFDDTFRDAQVIYLPPPPQDPQNQNRFNNNPFYVGRESGVAWTVALLRGVGGDLYRKQIYVSGLPFIDESDINDPLSDPVFVASFQQYRLVLTQSYGFPIWRKDVQTFPLRPITAINPGPPITLTIPNHGVPNPPAPGSRGFISKAHYYSPSKIKFNGPWGIAQVVDANTLILANFPPPGVPFQWVYGYFQLQQKDVQNYTDVIVERFTHRKRGRPFDSPRGRSRTRARSLTF